MSKKQLIEALAVTAEITGTTMTDAAAKMMINDLIVYPEQFIFAALTKCRREIKGRLTLADIISRIDDGRPGVEEAWAMIPKSENETVVWTDEMAVALGVAQPLINEGDLVAARMAFKEKYNNEIQSARDQSKPVNWTTSLGHDPAGRESALRKAVDAGRISYQHAQKLIPSFEIPENIKQIATETTKKLTSEEGVA